MSEPAQTGREWPLKRLLTDVMGSGPKSADDMSYDQARGAMAEVLDRSADPTTVGAFLLASRWKVNTPAELAGFLDAIRATADLAEPSADPVDCGANYDGKRETALLGVAAAAVAAAVGVPVVVHAADRVPAKRADTYTHVLRELGISTALAPMQSARMVDETGVGFYYQPRFAPTLHDLLDRREAMGVRTPINTVETLINPAEADVHLGSFFHLSYGRRLLETIRKSRSLNVERALVIQGLEGYDDVRPGQTTVAEWRGGDIDDWRIDSKTFGVNLDRADLGVDAVVQDSAALTRAVLAGNRGDDFVDLVALNAALRIYAGGEAESIAAGVDLARGAIDNGSALSVLEALQSYKP